MTIIVDGFLNELLVTRGYASSAVGPSLTSYVDPVQVRVLSNDSAISEIEPTRVIVIQ